ncbi:MAG: hypothetical protein BGO30_07140 [Bacteroidetes bacterium 41-46]|nr:MAG: hypothetical protein BGO30_07140 [Bacteroidetes bacterium 41-46]
MDVKNLTAEERAALKAEIEQQELAEKQKRKDDTEAYKALVDESVKNVFPILAGISEKLAKNKAEIRDKFNKAISMKAELYGIKDQQRSHTFTDVDGQFRVTLGYYTTDNYDDTVEAGIQIVREYLASLAKDSDSQLLVDTIMKLLSKDQKGTLKASRVLQLQQLADKTGDKRFLEGVQIIRDAYRPIESKTYVKAEYKDEIGAWKNLPLGMTEA